MLPEFENNEGIESQNDKKPVDWWNRYVVTGAAIILLIFALYWLVTTYII